MSKKIKFNPDTYLTYLNRFLQSDNALTDQEYQKILDNSLLTKDNFNETKRLENFNPEAYIIE
jgi:hypothetical protein